MKSARRLRGASYTANMALPWGAPLTRDDLTEMPDDGHRYEIVDGALLVTPSPGYQHQASVTELLVLLHGAIGPELVVLAAPFDYVVDPATVLQPDLLVARRADVGPKSLERAAPLLVIEILSPSTRLTDLGTKRLAYQRGGAPVYWVIDTDEPSLTVFRLQDGVYIEEASTVGGAVYRTESPFAVEIVPARLAPPATGS
jgi:Uma2 family endonuclease